MRRILFSFLLAALSLSAAGTSITGISCTGNIATVTVANTLVASQGFEIAGSSVSAYNINGTAATANSTSFTFAVACSGSATGGTFQPAWQVITLAIVPTNSGFTITDALWLTTTTPTACPGCTSAVPGITAAQLAALQAGTTVEQVVTFGVLATETTAQMNTQVQTLYNNAQASFAAGGLTKFVGWCFNGSAWSATCN